jgi:hypothetical protein
MLVKPAFALFMVVALSAFGAESDLIVGVNLEAMLKSKFPDAKTVVERREVSSLPPAVWYRCTIDQKEYNIGVAVHRSTSRATNIFSATIYSDFGVRKVEGVGDEAKELLTGEIRIVRKNVCIYVKSKADGGCRAVAELLDKALAKEAPTGAAVPVPKISIVVHAGTASKPDATAEIKIQEDAPLLVDKDIVTKPPWTMYSVVVIPGRPIVMTTRANVVFEVPVPAPSVPSASEERKSTEAASATNAQTTSPALPPVRNAFDRTLPRPGAIIQKYNHPSVPKPKVPQEAIDEMKRWFDANRDSDAYEAALDDAYWSIGWAFRESADPAQAETYFAGEVKRTQNPKALYAANAELARVYAARKEYDKAEKTWLEARRVMLNGTHPYFTTRQALPYVELGKMYKDADNSAKAIEYFELYQSTEYGKKEEKGLCESLGNLYAARGDWAKAVALYRFYIDAYSRLSVADSKYIQDLIKKFQERLDRALERLDDK